MFTTGYHHRFFTFCWAKQIYHILLVVLTKIGMFAQYFTQLRSLNSLEYEMSHAFKKEIQPEAKLHETGWNINSFDLTIHANLKEISWGRGAGRGAGWGVSPKFLNSGYALAHCIKLFVIRVLCARVKYVEIVSFGKTCSLVALGLFSILWQ